MRANFDDYVFEICRVVSSRSTCDRAAVGAVLVKDKLILATGYNGSPRGAPHCDDVGHELDGDHCVRTTHAEANAIAQAARHGVSVDGATMYCTHAPCYNCAKLMINAGITKIKAIGDYHASDRSKELFLKLSLSHGTSLTVYEDSK